MKQLSMTEPLYEYLLDVSLREHPALAALRHETAQLNWPLARMMSAPDQVQFMQMLIRLIDAKKVLEVGTFTGYTSLGLALALPDIGHLHTCDISDKWPSLGRPYWEQANQSSKISLHVGHALDTLSQFREQGMDRNFDFIFIDADNANYLNYYKLALPLLSDNGIMAIDNVLWKGKVIDEAISDRQTNGIRELNTYIKQDKHVETSLLPVADGLFLVKHKNKKAIEE